MKSFLIAAILVLVGLGVQAGPQAYRLDHKSSRLAFEWQFGQNLVTGEMPITLARIAIDFDALENSAFLVVADVRGARAGVAFATPAIKSSGMLDAAGHPEIIFESTHVTRAGKGAVIDGRLTVRGVTRPVRFQAHIYRERGSDPADLTVLVVQLSGAVQRSDFGATGWADMVDDRVALKIEALIRKAP